MSAAKAVRTRPYVLIFDGKTHIVDASSKSSAIAHLAGPLVDEIRVAKGKDVAAFVRSGGQIEQAGEYPEREVLPELPIGEGRTHGDASAIDDETQ